MNKLVAVDDDAQFVKNVLSQTTWKKMSRAVEAAQHWSRKRNSTQA
jgi:hypothetical protein